MRTRIFLFVAMDFQMAAQVAFVVEQLVAFGTFRSKLLRALVHGHVIFVVSQLRETLSTLLAGVSR